MAGKGKGPGGIKIPFGISLTDSCQENVSPKRPFRVAWAVRSKTLATGPALGIVTHAPGSSYPSTIMPSSRIEGPFTVTSSRLMLTICLPKEEDSDIKMETK